MLVYVATKNAGKLREIKAITAPLGWKIGTYDAYLDVAEIADSYVGNARLKARALAAQLRHAGIVATVLGDDSGIEVEALNGRPGIYSARYGPVGASWPDRRRLLLEEVRDTGDSERRARFISAIVVVDRAGNEVEAIGEVRGRLASVEQGDGGFSYDAIFEYPPLCKTFGELDEHAKNAVSHRTRAISAVAAQLAEMETGRTART